MKAFLNELCEILCDPFTWFRLAVALIILAAVVLIDTCTQGGGCLAWCPGRALAPMAVALGGRSLEFFFRLQRHQRGRRSGRTVLGGASHGFSVTGFFERSHGAGALHGRTVAHHPDAQRAYTEFLLTI